MPGARTNTPNPPGTTSAGVYGMVSNLAGAAFASPTTSRSAATEAASIPGSLFEDIPGGSSAEKGTYITVQRERLANMLRALDNEQQTLDLAYGSSPAQSKRPLSSGSGAAGGGGLKTKSKSEQSFENVDYDDARHTPGSTPPKLATEGRRTTSGNWIPAGVSGWFGGAAAAGTSGGVNDRVERNREDSSAAATVSKGWSAARDITEEMARGTSSGVDTGER